MSQNGKGSRRRPGKPGAFEEGWERIFGRKEPHRHQWCRVSEVDPWVCQCGESRHPNIPVRYLSDKKVIPEPMGDRKYHEIL